MTKRVKWDIDKVKEFVKENSECELLSKYYYTMSGDLKFMCECGEIFYTPFSNFKRKNNSIRECYKCGGRRKPRRKGNKPVEKWTIKEMKDFVENKSNSGCKFISAERDGTTSRICLICRCGKEFSLRFSDFKDRNQRSCNFCLGRIPWSYEMIKNYIESDDAKCKLLSREYKTTKEKLLLQCKCGQVFEAEFDSFRFMNKKQCNDCGRKLSNGENEVKNKLSRLNVDFKREYVFDNCRNERPLPFDFAIFDKNDELCALIEYQGIQHYKPVNFGGISNKKALNRFNVQKKNDEIKSQYCKENNIPLLKIPYWKFDNIEEMLSIELSKYGLLNNEDLG